MTPILKMEVMMQNPKLTTLVRIRYYLTIAQHIFGLGLIALDASMGAYSFFLNHFF